MLKPLTRDYWPDEMRRPIMRLAGALALAPLPVIALFLLIAFTIIVRQTGDTEAGLWRVRSFAPVVAVACYVIMLTGGLLCFLLLWSLRRRGVLDFTVIGLLLGVAAAVVAPLITDNLSLSPPVYVLLAIVCALMMLTLRRFAGVRTL